MLTARKKAVTDSTVLQHALHCYAQRTPLPPLSRCLALRAFPSSDPGFAGMAPRGHCRVPTPLPCGSGEENWKKKQWKRRQRREGWGGVRAEKIFPLLEQEDKLRAVVGFKKEEAMCLVTRPLPLISTSKTENQLIRAAPAAPPPAHPAL